MADAADQLYAQQQVILTQLADLRVDVRALSQLSGDVRELTGRVDTQLAHGSRKMDDLEGRMRKVEDALPDRLGERLGVLESGAERRRGGISVLQLILSLLGSSTVAALITLLITYLLTRR